MRITIDYPGYWAHGKTYEAKRETLQIRPGQGTVQGEAFKYRWAAAPTDDPDIFEVECYVVNDPRVGEFAVPVTCGRELAEVRA